MWDPGPALWRLMSSVKRWQSAAPRQPQGHQRKQPSLCVTQVDSSACQGWYMCFPGDISHCKPCGHLSLKVSRLEAVCFVSWKETCYTSLTGPEPGPYFWLFQAHLPPKPTCGCDSDTSAAKSDAGTAMKQWRSELSPSGW